jgi:hypothetical protein
MEVQKMNKKLAKNLILITLINIIGIEGIRTPQGINLIVSNYCILPMKTIPNKIKIINILLF